MKTNKNQEQEIEKKDDNKLNQSLGKEEPEIKKEENNPQDLQKNEQIKEPETIPSNQNSSGN